MKKVRGFVTPSKKSLTSFQDVQRALRLLEKEQKHTTSRLAVLESVLGDLNSRVQHVESLVQKIDPVLADLKARLDRSQWKSLTGDS